MPRSQAEVRMAHAVMSGKARHGGMSREYAEEVVEKMHGRKMGSLPKHTKGGVLARAKRMMHEG